MAFILTFLLEIARAENTASKEESEPVNDSEEPFLSTLDIIVLGIAGKISQNSTEIVQ